MLSLAIRNFSARKLRALSTAAAVFFGVAMIAGTLMLTESVNSSFDDIFAEVNEGIDVTVRPEVAVEGEFGAGASFARALPEELVDDVRAVEGVESAEGVIGDETITIIDEDGDRIGPPAGGPPHIAISRVSDEATFEPFSIIDGAHPTADDDVAIDSITAEQEGYEVGDTIRVTGAAGESDYTVAGIGEFGSGTPLGGASLVEFTLQEAQRLTGKEGRVDEIDVTAADGISPGDLATAITAALPPGEVEVRTGEQTAAEDASDIQEGFGFLSTALLVFAGIAVFVGAFLIFNTFSITVAQRMREFAMLRTLGASRRQVMAAVLLEAALVGLLASLLGIGGGFGFVELIKALFKAMGFELPTSGLALEPSTVAIAIAVGVITTVVAALNPALRATRVAPLEALVESAGGTEGEHERSRRRTVIAAVLVAAGLVLLPLGLFATDDIDRALQLLGLGLVLLFIGLAMVGDRFAGPIASALGWPIERLRGVTGRLARENAQRQPGRTATTAAALMIGVALVVFVGVFASSIRASLSDTLDRQFVGDIAIVNTDGFSPIPTKIVEEVGALDGVGTVSPTTLIPAEIDPGANETNVAGIDPQTLGQVASLDWVEGSDEVVADLAPDEAIVDENFADKEGLGVGDELEITGPSGDVVTATIAGMTTRSRFIVDTVALAHDTVLERLGARDDTTTFVNFAQGADPEGTRAEIDALLSDRFPNAEARSQEEFKQDREAEIDQLIALIYVLLGLSVLVSIFGVVNTLSLTIFERTRELGMLRAIGTSRRQVRRMIRYESVVVALLGAVVGAVIGLILAVAAVNALEDEGLLLSISPSLPVVVLIAAIVIGVVAAIGPARRASRLDVIQALQYE
jgi:putative ABC transport system permease protein